MFVFWHVEYSPDGLNCELVALQLAEYKQNGSSRAIPAEGDGFFEQKHLCEIGRIFKLGKVGLFIREPNGECPVFLGNVTHITQICLYLLRDLLIFRSH